jgi:DNA invertase Pin-like site-specific DNA recombinase/DNA-binding transcriptional MerR regulator
MKHDKVSQESAPASDLEGIGGTTKIARHHLDREAFVYIRQSCLQQLTGNQESTHLQYNLVRRACALGWCQDRVIVIDEDLGKSGKSSDDRSGFQRLLAEVSLGHAGIVLGIEMSRLARSCKDWYHLLELCGLFGCLLADSDGIYDPTNYNDRLLLGLKGTMSEAELHIMHGRLVSGKLNKARRGELFGQVPMGYVRLPDGRVAFDPDEQICSTVRMVFALFAELGSIHMVLRTLVRHHVQLGMHAHSGDNKGDVVWKRPSSSTLQYMLHNPLYAGAYAYGRSTIDPRASVKGKPYSGEKQLPQRDWKVLIKDALPAYITWEHFERNQARLAANTTRFASCRVAREGKSLLHGLIFCKRCSYRMVVAYSKKGFFSYQCTRSWLSWADPLCQSFSGKVVDELVAGMVLQTVAPTSLELSLSTMDSIQRERSELEKNWTQRLERAHFVSSRAARQYQLVEPENRLVARTLEQQWERSLHDEEKLKLEYEAFRKACPTNLSDEQVALIKRLSSDLPTIWHAATTNPRDRQMIVQSLVERVYVDTHGKTDLADVEILWKGGHVSRHRISHHVRAYRRRHDFEQLKARICDLREQGMTRKEISQRLNEEGFRPAKNAPFFQEHTITGIVQNAQLPPIRDPNIRLSRMLEKNEWPLVILAQELGIPYRTIWEWQRKGLLKSRRIDDGHRRVVAWADQTERHRLKQLYLSNAQNRHAEVRS